MDRVIVNGTFDVLHPGHVKLLKTARALGSFLLIAIDSDARVQQLKGVKPIFNQKDRKLMLEAYADAVMIFEHDFDLTDYIKRCSIDTMVKGADYYGTPIVGEHLIQNMVFIKRDEHSSTELKRKLYERYSSVG
jgi:D-beta-D-heptose 7-phosphate kinase/D-beta-D-heptose 1-phosphate adenosyltransferase